MADQLDLLSMVRPTDPDTSHAAARRTNVGRGQSIVLHTLLTHGPLTDFDIARLSGEDKGSMSKRRGELRDDFGWVERVKPDGVSPTGSAAARWQLTPEGVAEATRRARGVA